MSIESLVPGKGEVSFLWFNNYSGVIVRTPSKILVVDPADVDPTIFKAVDAVLITHEHYDHLDKDMVKEICRRTQCTVIADSTSSKRLKDVVTPDRLHEMRVGEETRLDNITVNAGPYRHPATNPVSYLITTEDDVKIYHTGDSLPHPDMKQIGEHSPDLVFCTVGAPAPGASPRTGMEIVQMVKPKVAVPYHAPAAERKEFAELVSKETSNVRCLAIEKDKPFKYP